MTATGEWLTIQETAARVGVTTQAVSKALRRGHLVGRRCPTGRWQIDWSSVEARYLADRTCPVCQATFRPGDRRARYCGRHCQRLADNRRAAGLPIDFDGHARQCAHCGRAFRTTRGHGRYCSTRCRVRGFYARHGLNPTDYTTGRVRVRGAAA